MENTCRLPAVQSCLFTLGHSKHWKEALINMLMQAFSCFDHKPVRQQISTLFCPRCSQRGFLDVNLAYSLFLSKMPSNISRVKGAGRKEPCVSTCVEHLSGLSEPMSRTQQQLTNKDIQPQSWVMRHLECLQLWPYHHNAEMGQILSADEEYSTAHFSCEVLWAG